MLSLTTGRLTLLIVVCGIDEIFAQFKVIKMEELRSVTPGRPLYGKGKVLRNSNSNVTVIQMKPLPPRGNRRVDKEIRKAEASDLEVITVKPVAGQVHGSLLKLHILNLRTGKIQDAIINTDDGESYQPQLQRRKSAGKVIGDKHRPVYCSNENDDNSLSRD